MDTNCASLLTGLFLYSYEIDCIQGLLKKTEKKLARSFNFTFRYNNCKFGDFVDRIYPIEHDIKDTIDIARSALYLDLQLQNWQIFMTVLWQNFNFPIVNFPFICSNIPTTPLYEYISLSWSGIPELVVPILISLIEGCC